MTPERWQQIEKMYHSALARESAQRVAFLQEACAGDEALRKEVESLLRQQDQAESFIEAPVMEVVAQGMATDSDQPTVVTPSRLGHSMIGQTISHYRILEKLGEGGMGVVYKAQDLRLERLVALKFLPPGLSPDEEEKERFIREAKAASALDHPNIGTIYEISESDDGQMFIVMAYYEGETLKQKVERGPLPVKEAVDIAAQIALGLAKAHSRQIVHRDIKPGNLVVTPDGLVKIIDFGLAKLGGLTKITKSHTTMGTVAYISPEQARGEDVDERTDVWSLGVVLYEMLTGQLPFPGAHAEAIIHAILTGKPRPLKQLRGDADVEIERIVHRALEKDLKSRHASAAEVLKDLTDYQSSLALPEMRLSGWKLVSGWIRQKRVAIPGLLILLVLGSLLGWYFYRQAKVNWARNVALPEIVRLVENFELSAAFRLARQAERYIPGDPQLQRLWRNHSFKVSIRTAPPGADIYVRGLPNTDWEFIGRSPIENLRVSLQDYHLRVTKPGFVTLEGAFVGQTGILETDLVLDPEGGASSSMVRVPAGDFSLGGAPPVRLEDYRIDRYEVTNQQYKQFMDKGGYQKREYWKQPFWKNRQILTWEEAMAHFRDATGRPGPSTWELGTYPEGRSDFPVSGVSWYEAAAYADFAGKNLPTIYHWYRAALGARELSNIVDLSNFNGRGPAKVGTHQGIATYGAYDMAGNVKEWCWNQVGNQRYILGGGWKDPGYKFVLADAHPPFERPETFGFRCAKYAASLPAVLGEPVEMPSRDYSRDRPVSDEVFHAYKRMYSYDRTDLKAVTESVEESEHWRKEKISFNAAYGNERVTAYLFLPRSTAPPHQTVVYFPSLVAFDMRSSDLLEMDFTDFLMRSGRAVMYPVYQGTYERKGGPAIAWSTTYRDVISNAHRDRVIQWSKDLGRSIDYLETRPEIDRDRLAFYSVSMGSIFGPLLTAVDGRFKASVLVAGGLLWERSAPEVDPFNFAPHDKTPTLMINARIDNFYPVETFQKPMFRVLGVREKDKRHAVFEGDHIPERFQDVIKETLDWLDRYLGPVKNIVVSDK